MSAGDTIAAIATASGEGGVGIVRISGPRALAIAADVLGIDATRLDRRVRIATARAETGARIDDVLAFAMRGPKSFTGEDVAELHGHGGSHNLAQLLAAVVARGARLAGPGEFTRRAVENGKLDLPRAEALLAVISASGERSWRLAQQNLGGRLGEVAAALERRVLGALAEIEGRIDFPEADLGAPSEAALARELAELTAATEQLASTFRHASAVHDGVTVALVGAVNAGKSSLLNALTGRERALVDAAPGTTRDYLEARDDWDGVAVTVIDTAGLRADAGAVEQRGIELGAARVADADVVVIVSAADGDEYSGPRFPGRELVVRSKADLEATRGQGEPLRTSARTGEGLAELKRRVLALVGIGQREGAEDALIATARQHRAAVTATERLRAAAAAWPSTPAELVALELRDAARALAELRGVAVGDRVLDEVFARFCIGK